MTMPMHTTDWGLTLAVSDILKHKDVSGDRVAPM